MTTQFTYCKSISFWISEDCIVSFAEVYLEAFFFVMKGDFTARQIFKRGSRFQCNQLSSIDLKLYHYTVIQQSYWLYFLSLTKLLCSCGRMTSFLVLIRTAEPCFTLNNDLTLRQVVCWSLSLTSIRTLGALIQCITRYNGIVRSCLLLEDHLVCRDLSRLILAP